MSLTRRHFLSSSLSCLAVLGAGVYAPTNKANNFSEVLLLSAATDHRGMHYIVALTESGGIYYQIPIDERAHDSLFNTKRFEAIYFGRSPSQSIYIVNVLNKKLVRIIQASSDRHFYGHGVIDKTSRYLLTVENNTNTGKGCIGIYDISDHYRRVGEIESQGVGPHQLLLLSDNKTLAVANGGLKTTSPKANNNLGAKHFETSLVYIDTVTGTLLEKYHSNYAGNSLRHISVNAEDEIFIGAQSYDEQTSPLVFSHKGEEQLVPFKAEDFIWQAHNHYTASVAVSGKTLSVSSPRGNIVSFWDIEKRKYISKIHRLDIAGLFTQAGGQHNQLFASTGEGLLVDIDIARKAIRKNHLAHGLSLDNHLSATHICC